MLLLNELNELVIADMSFMNSYTGLYDEQAVSF